MNTPDVLKYGHTFLLEALERVPREAWQQGGVCGAWSVRDIVAHLAACEGFLGELLASWGADAVDDFGVAMGAAYSAAAVELRAADTPAQVLTEYKGAYERVAQLIGAIDAESLRRPGTLAWYGNEYALDDFVVYSYYGHKREHGAQVAVFADRLAR